MNDAVALAQALTGQTIELRPGSATQIADQLAEAGWPAHRIRQLWQQSSANQIAWPFPPDKEVLQSVGAARFYAMLTEVRMAMGLMGGPDVIRPDRKPDAREQQLQRDRPPHW